MDHSLLQKPIIILILVLWIIDVLRTKKQKHSDPAIEEAYSRERHEWRYLRWGFRAIQMAATTYILVQLIQLLLR
ncbi:hypothetical protein [Rahnella victoriana]|uniref:hypothetical protein n=1 Tax=Rahnella victoriana TaxID=1510570 RepID=UPI0010392433|nr:hypothetical protein EYY67_12425 [Rahnella victoriana]